MSPTKKNTAIEPEVVEPEVLDPEGEPEISDEELDEPIIDEAEIVGEAKDPRAVPVNSPAKAEPLEKKLPAFAAPSSKEVRVRDPLQLYLKEIARFPMLEPDEEYALAKRVQDENDQDAAFKLVSSHLRLVVKIAMDFQRRWMQNALDLIQEGNVGLLKAVTKFDPEKGIKFSYYAAFWVKAYILKYIMDNWRMVKVGTTQTQRKLFYNLNKERQRLQAMGFDPTTEALSKSLGVSESEIEEMDQRLSKNDMSLNTPLGEDSDATKMDFLPSLGPGVEDTIASDQIVGLLLENIKSIRPTLNEKEIAILDDRLLSEDPITLREIGENFGVTRERVRQIEARLLSKIREHMTDKVKDFSQDWVLEHD